jgi:hypothetical protein
MITDPSMALLKDILDRQNPIEPVRTLDSERCRKALTGGQPFSRSEKLALWSDPLAREALAIARRDLLAEAEIAWRSRALTLRAKAAASDTTRKTVIETPDMRLEITPIGSHGWVISLTVSQTVRQHIFSGMRVRIEDNDGLVWLEGAVDENGQYADRWSHPEWSPIQRLHTRSLTLIPTL